ncbi:MAG: hypothetical protein ACREX5_19550, partial [Achromobacter pestifer]
MKSSIAKSGIHPALPDYSYEKSGKGMADANACGRCVAVFLRGGVEEVAADAQNPARIVAPSAGGAVGAPASRACAPKQGRAVVFCRGFGTTPMIDAVTRIFAIDISILSKYDESSREATGRSIERAKRAGSCSEKCCSA